MSVTIVNSNEVKPETSIVCNCGELIGKYQIELSSLREENIRNNSHNLYLEGQIQWLTEQLKEKIGRAHV